MADLCFHLIPSVVFQELWQDPEGRGGGGETSGRQEGAWGGGAPLPAPHVTPPTDDSATWKGLEASVLRWQDECVTWARALGPHWVTSRVTLTVSSALSIGGQPL